MEFRSSVEASLVLVQCLILPGARILHQRADCRDEEKTCERLPALSHLPVPWWCNLCLSNRAHNTPNYYRFGPSTRWIQGPSRVHLLLQIFTHSKLVVLQQTLELHILYGRQRSLFLNHSIHCGLLVFGQYPGGGWFDLICVYSSFISRKSWLVPISGSVIDVPLCFSLVGTFILLVGSLFPNLSCFQLSLISNDPIAKNSKFRFYTTRKEGDHTPFLSQLTFCFPAWSFLAERISVD